MVEEPLRVTGTRIHRGTSPLMPPCTPHRHSAKSCNKTFGMLVGENLKATPASAAPSAQWAPKVKGQQVFASGPCACPRAQMTPVFLSVCGTAEGVRCTNTAVAMVSDEMRYFTATGPRTAEGATALSRLFLDSTKHIDSRFPLPVQNTASTET